MVNLSRLNIRIFLMLGVLPVLAACGGSSSGGGGSSSGSGTNTGQFTDVPVAGLLYQTATLSGETDGTGHFQYRAGEMVSFRVGDILIGQAAGASTVTPFDLAGEAAPQTSLEIRRAINRMHRSARATPLEVATNIAVFLQTLDEDGDLTNGIQIPPQIHILAGGVSIDFDETLFRFSRNPSFRQLIVSGRAIGLWNFTRPIRNNAYALNTLYSGLGLGFSADSPEIVETDSDANNIVDSSSTYGYDAHGNIIEEQDDIDGNGSVDSRRTYAYDSNGNLVKEDHEEPVGSLVFRTTNTYNPNGLLIQRDEDFDGNNVIDSRTTYSYDTTNDYLIQEDHDSPIGGSVELRIKYTYDADGNLTVQERYSNGNVLPNYRLTQSYDAYGDVILSELDSNGDTNIDSRIAYTYDSSGHVLQEDHDDPFGGPLDFRITYNYDADGNETKYEFDSGADGNVDSRVTYTYDANGNITQENDDLDSVVTYSYDSNGNQTQSLVQDVSGSLPDYRTNYTNAPVAGWAGLLD